MTCQSNNNQPTFQFSPLGMLQLEENRNYLDDFFGDFVSGLLACLEKKEQRKRREGRGKAHGDGEGHLVRVKERRKSQKTFLSLVYVGSSVNIFNVCYLVN